tara:strand:- start:984 stop:1169 length:186 start_codon:yes stop_codon:yes gene_type:complete
MTKEFKINDILEAVSIISKNDREKRKINKKNIYSKKNDVLTLNNPVKPTKRDILVLDEMIE